MRTPQGEHIFRVLKRHIGRDQAITARDICRELGWSAGLAREVRRIIAAEYSAWSAVVCARAGRGASGYFIAETYEEAQTYRAWLDDLVTVAATKVVAFDEACSKMGLKFKERKRDA